MSHISYAFNHSDIEATAYALTVLPRLGLAESEAQAEINYQLCCSAAKKLINHATDITPDEFRTIIAALQAAKLIILGDIEVDAKTCSECKSYFFTINKFIRCKCRRTGSVYEACNSNPEQLFCTGIRLVCK